MTARYRPHPDLAWRDVDGHVFAISRDGRQHELDGPVARHVWLRCVDAPRTLDDLVDDVVKTFEVDVVRARADLERFLGELVQAQMLVSDEEGAADPGGTP